MESLMHHPPEMEHRGHGKGTPQVLYVCSRDDLTEPNLKTAYVLWLLVLFAPEVAKDDLKTTYIRYIVNPVLGNRAY
jgi:hypothetical protein